MASALLLDRPGPNLGERTVLVMKTLIVTMLLAAGVVVYADAVFARGGGAGGGGGSGASGAGGAPGAAGAAAGTGGEGAEGTGSPADNSAAETGPGDRLGGPAAGYANDPSIYRSPASAWPAEVEYPSASPRSGAIVTPPSGGVYVAPPATGVIVAPPGSVVAPPGAVIVPSQRVQAPTTPLMCPGINAADPRTC
jgi:hypothetical protein